MNRALSMASAAALAAISPVSGASAAAILTLSPQPLLQPMLPSEPILDLAGPVLRDPNVTRVAGIFFMPGRGAGGGDTGLSYGLASMVPAPEPASLAVIGAALTGLGAIRWGRRR